MPRQGAGKGLLELKGAACPMQPGPQPLHHGRQRWVQQGLAGPQAARLA